MSCAADAPRSLEHARDEAFVEVDKAWAGLANDRCDDLEVLVGAAGEPILQGSDAGCVVRTAQRLDKLSEAVAEGVVANSAARPIEQPAEYLPPFGKR